MQEDSNNSCLKFTKENITLRREHVLRLAAQGMTQQEIVNALGNVVSRPLISLDLQFLKETAAQTINEYVTETIPFEFNKTVAAFSVIIKEGFKMLNDKDIEIKDRVAVSNMLMEALNKYMELITGSVVVSRARQGMLEMEEKLKHMQEEQPHYNEVF
jgi:hypothetical protein